METATNKKLKVYETMNNCLCQENKKMKSCVDFQEQQQEHMQQQIVRLLTHPMFPAHQHAQEQPSDYDHKRDTPTTPKAMTDSPEQAQRKKVNNMAPHNLMASLAKPKRSTTHTHDPAVLRQSTRWLNESPDIHQAERQQQHLPPMQQRQLEASKSNYT
jgi:hypothetical protein